MIAIVAPGQGSQTPGMLQPWLDLDGAEATIRWMSTLTGLDLLRLGTSAEADEIKDTAITQPLVVCLALLAFEQLKIPNRDNVIVAGHSVGELAAAAMAGALHRDSAVALAAVRGGAMANACALAKTSMAAVVGGDREEVIHAIEAAGLSAANVNGGGQIVAAGTAEQIAALVADPPPKARVISLPVAGAFHTKYMQPAMQIMTSIRDGIPTADPTVRLLSNADGTAVSSGADYLTRLVSQIVSPVRWDLCMQTMLDAGVSAMIELPPAGALTGLARRGMKGVKTLAIKTPDDLAAAHQLISDSAAS
ncbi:MAG: ACP S-malonyltransferase [Antricoccus sp.]